MQEAIVWIDAEFSGTSPHSDELLEIAAIITDLSGRKIGQSFQALFDVKNLSKVIAESSDLVKEMHDKSGLWFDLWNSSTESFRKVQDEMLQWIDSILEKDTLIYFGGNSITRDRNFVEINLPKIYLRISHQSVDVTSMAIAFKANVSISKFPKEHKHRALSDVKESIEEYCYYVKYLKSLERMAHSLL